MILNVSATEDHGPHMPLDTDTVLGMAVANGVAERRRTRSSSCRPIPYGFNEHHKDFPGRHLDPAGNADRLRHRCHRVARASRVPPHPAAELARLEPPGARPRGAQDGDRDRHHLRLGLLLEPLRRPHQRTPQVGDGRHRPCRRIRGGDVQAPASRARRSRQGRRRRTCTIRSRFFNLDLARGRRQGDADALVVRGFARRHHGRSDRRGRRDRREIPARPPSRRRRRSSARSARCRSCERKDHH